MKVDTEIRHVTKPGANLFLELGFAPDEARRLHAASRKHIDDTRLLKRQLIEELSIWIAEHHLTQADAAEILEGLSPTRVGCGEQENGQVHNRYAGGNAWARRQGG